MLVIVDPIAAPQLSPRCITCSVLPAYVLLFKKWGPKAAGARTNHAHKKKDETIASINKSLYEGDTHLGMFPRVLYQNTQWPFVFPPRMFFGTRPSARTKLCLLPVSSTTLFTHCEASLQAWTTRPLSLSIGWGVPQKRLYSRLWHNQSVAKNVTCSDWAKFHTAAISSVEAHQSVFQERL